MKKKLRRAKLSTNVEYRQHHLNRRIVTPILVDGVRLKGMEVIKPDQYDRLNIDDKVYQRIRITRKVNTLIHVLTQGGSIPDPLSIAERPDGSWWIVDGQQRFWAYYDLNLPLTACIYYVPNIEVERNLFLALQNVDKVNSDFTVHAWAGPSAVLLRDLEANSSSMYFEQINFGPHRNRPYSSALLARALGMLLGPQRGHMGRIQDVLSRVDTLLTTAPRGEEKAQAFLAMLPHVFPPGADRLRLLPTLALSSVAKERWEKHIVTPLGKVTDKLSAVNWATAVPSHAIKFLPLLEDIVRKKWK